MHNDYDEADVRRYIEQLAAAVAGEFPPDRPINVVGIRTRGEVLAERLTVLLAARGYAKIGRGVLDITFYRDDLSAVGPSPLVRPTLITIPLDGVPLVLVDDVIFTGRSVRAALDALTDFGRPSLMRLAVLVDRGGRELPIQADFVGLTVKDVPRDHRVKVKLKETDGGDEILVERRA